MLHIVFINLFFCPMLAVLIFFKRNKKEIQCNIDILLLYGILVSVNLTITKIFLVFFRRIIGRDIGVESTYYTLFALISAFLIPYVYEIMYKSLKISCDIEKKK